jgi:KRAB domain-containing zinc finger protein
MSQIHAGPNLICNLCGRGYGGKSQLKKHLLFSHPEADKFPCSVCTMDFHIQEDCEAHEKFHEPDSFICFRWHCPSYKKDLGSLEDLRAHVQTTHNIIRARARNKLEFMCETCGKICQSKGYLEVHKRFHTKEKPFKCSHCPKSFYSLHHIQSHELSVHFAGSQEFPCSLCGRKFTTVQYLYVHRKWHRDGEPVKKPGLQTGEIGPDGPKPPKIPKKRVIGPSRKSVGILLK